jgi:hypothetical protein
LFRLFTNESLRYNVHVFLFATSVNLESGKPLTNFLMLSSIALLFPAGLALFRATRRPVKQSLRRVFLISFMLHAFVVLVVWLLTRSFTVQALNINLIHQHRPSTAVLAILSAIGALGLLVSSILVLTQTSKEKERFLPKR